MNVKNRKDLTRFVWGFTLGDGWLVVSTGSKNAHYGLHQIAIHKDYVNWQAEVLETLTKVRTREKEEYINSQGANAKPSIRIETMNHPFYTTLYERVYTNLKVKQISPHDLKLLDWQNLACLYQDDGYIEVSANKYAENYVRVRIATDNYSFADVNLLQKAIFEKYKITFNVIKRKLKYTYGYRLEAKKDNAKRFLEGVEPYMFPSFHYKLDVDKVTVKSSLSKVRTDNP
jgi:hypothetical protein